MCLIIVCPPGHMPPREVFEETIKQNKDGSGWVMRGTNKSKSFLAHKSLSDTDKVLESFLAARKAHPQSWCMWHSRLASRGTKNTDDNVHPFRVPNRPWMMAHNGTLDFYDLPIPSRVFCERSDSRIFAEDCLPNWHWQDLHSKQADLEKYIGNSKIVIISAQREQVRPVFILNEAKGIWDKDDHCWYSHTIYVQPPRNPAWESPYHPKPPEPAWKQHETYLAREAREKREREAELEAAIKAATEDPERDEGNGYVTDWDAISKAVANGSVEAGV